MECCKIKEFYQELVGLEYIMANPAITLEEMYKRLDYAIKEAKRKFNKILFGDEKCR